jgi:hypothetical protein
MKTSHQSTTDKLSIRYDNELKMLLMQDLKAFRQRGQFTSNKQAVAQQAA